MRIRWFSRRRRNTVPPHGNTPHHTSAPHRTPTPHPKRPPNLPAWMTQPTLAGLLYEAMHDLYHLNPHDGPHPRDLFDRFVAWGPFRRSGG